MDKQFFYYSNGQPIKVTAEEYDTLVKSDNKIHYFEYDLKVDRTVRRNGELVRLPSRETSLDRLMELHNHVADDSVDVIAEVEHTLLLEKLRSCLKRLDAEELELIWALYFAGHTERSWSMSTGIPSMTIHDKKICVLKKCRRLIGL